MSIIGIEGNSFSGKTELTEGLGKGEYSIIKEPSYYIDTFPPSPHDYNSAKKNLEIFAEIEKKRSADALEDVENGRTVLMDRTLWTYILYEYVLQARFPNRPNAYQYSIDLFQKLSEGDNFVVPEILIALTPGSEETLKQRILQRRPTSIDFLNHWETTVLTDYVLEKIVGIYGPQNAISIINDKSPEDMVLKATCFLERKTSCQLCKDKIFETLRNIVKKV